MHPQFAQSVLYFGMDYPLFGAIRWLVHSELDFCLVCFFFSVVVVIGLFVFDWVKWWFFFCFGYCFYSLSILSISYMFLSISIWERLPRFFFLVIAAPLAASFLVIYKDRPRR